MAFGVTVEEADGTIVATYDHRYSDADRWVDLWIESVMPDYGDPAYPLLGNVDPYDHTIFNGLQVESLIRELASLDIDAHDVERREILRRLRGLCTLCRREDNRRLRFTGD